MIDLIVASPNTMTLKVISRPNVLSLRMSDLLRAEKSGIDESALSELRPEIQKSIHSHSIPLTSRPPREGMRV